MSKRIVSFLTVIIICFTLLCPLSVNAVTPLDPEKEASLSLTYEKDGNAFSNLKISIFRVAEAFSDGTFELIEPFSSYPVNIHNIMEQEKWFNISQTLGSYIVADNLKPDREVKTDQEGKAEFSDLKTGLYFVREVIAENNSGTYIFNHFMVYLPTPQADGSYNYSVVAKPKCTSFVPKTQYTVTKLWQDAGNQDSRPKEVTVDIYKDGKLHETKLLNAQNNWSYTWYVSENDNGIFTVAEREVPSNYKVTIQQNGSNFTVINSRENKTDPPVTGDTFAPLPWILVLCFCGVALLLLGIYAGRRK